MLIDVKLPEVSESITAADVVKVLVAVGETVSVDQALLEVETEKALFELPSPEAGAVAEILVKAGDKVSVGQVLLRIEAAAAQSAVSSAPQRPSPDPSLSPQPSALSPASPRRSSLDLPPSVQHSALGTPSSPAAPSVRRLARELGVDMASISGTGPRGRISKEDVMARAKVLVERPAAPAAPARHLPDFTRWGNVQREPLSTVRRLTGEAMALSWATVPQVTQYDGADITELEAFRAKSAKEAEKAGGKLTVTALLLKIVAAALRAFPRFNASLDEQAGEIVIRENIHIGVAVDTERGLLVPVVRDADKKNVTTLAAELTSLAERARTKKLLPDEMEGGTFTISNLGGIGGTAFSPIVYWPQAAILGVARSEIRPVWREGRFDPRLVLPLSLSYDHRLIDGAEGARFLRWFCGAIEEPWLALM